MLKKLLQLTIAVLFLFTSFAEVNRISAQDYQRLQALSANQTIGNIEYFSATEFANLFNVRTYYNPQARKMIVYLPEKRLKFSGYSSFIFVNSEVYHLPHPVVPNGEDLLVPVQAFVEIMQPALDVRMDYQRDLSEMNVENTGMNILDFMVEEKANGTLIRMPVARQFNENQIRAWQGNSGWHYVTVQNGVADQDRFKQFKTNDEIRRVEVEQMDNSVQIAFQLRDRDAQPKLEVYQNKNPKEIVINLRKTNTTVSQLNEARDKWKLDRIILDAGHGGKDGGAVGYGGLLEKNVVLDVTKRLGQIIEDKMPDVEVLYTRENDKFLELKERTEFANENNGKLFVSIHANANHNKRAKGFETYLLRPGKTQDAVEVAERENSVIKLEDNPEYYKDHGFDENRIMATMMQSVFVKESEDFASMVQGGLHRQVPSSNRGVKQAGFYVLWGASMPNILVEIGFITNPTEGRNLGSAAYRQKIAEGIYKGIADFKEKYDKQLAEQASL
jgi:N-acetylmuramoyl-L-alanine amidase